MLVMSGIKRVVLTMQQRLDILKELKTSSISSVAEKYNVHHTTVRRVREKAAIIAEFAKKGKKEKCRRRLKKPTYEELEQQLLTWYMGRRNIGDRVSDTLILEKAAELKEQISTCSNFKVSKGWLASFKRRNRIRLVRAHNKKNSEDETDEDEDDENGTEEERIQKFMNKFQETIKKDDINLECIYSLGETELLWRGLPMRVFAGDTDKSVSEYKKQDEKIAIWLCANATGTHKVMPLLIQEYKDPEALKLLLVDWFDNHFKKAVQMHQLEKVGKLCGKVILLINNCAGHKFPNSYIHDDHFEVKYFPTNIASFQPLYQGIIENMKRSFRYKMTQRFVQYGSNIEEFYTRYSIKDCIEMIVTAWNEVTDKDIRNAWQNIVTQIKTENEDEAEEEEEENIVVQMQQVWTDIVGHNITNEDVEDYLTWCNEEEKGYSREVKDTNESREEDMDIYRGEDRNEDRDEGRDEKRDEDETVRDRGIKATPEEREELEDIFKRLERYNNRIPRSSQLFVKGLKLMFLGDP